MIIKKFQGKTEEEAVEAAKKELGSGVVIMNVKNVKKKGLFSFFTSKIVEVTVALEEENESLERIRRETGNSSVNPAKNSNTPTVRPIEKETQDNVSIEKKLDSLQTLLENQIKNNSTNNAKTETNNTMDIKTEDEKKDTKDSDKEPPQEESEQEKFLKLLYNTMIDNEVDEKYANQIIEEIDKNNKPNIPIDYILANVYQKMILKFGKSEEIKEGEDGCKVVLFLGPTGVGKTTTIAKVASNFAVDGKKRVALLTLDTYRIAAAEQLRTYANILEVPFRVIYTKDELKEAIEDFKDYDFVFIDTAGHSHQNEEQLRQTRELLEGIEDAREKEIFLVLSATTKYRDLLRIADNYKQITDYQLIFTKLDETTTMGNLFNMRMHTGTPIAYTTCGQNVPNDIERFNAQKIVKQLLGGKR